MKTRTGSMNLSKKHGHEGTLQAIDACVDGNRRDCVSKAKGGMFWLSPSDAQMFESAIRIRVESAKENVQYKHLPRMPYARFAREDQNDPIKNASYKEWQKWLKLYEKNFGKMP